jgi:hypothetical protein
VPESLLIPLAEGETVRPHLRLSAQHGCVNVHVHLELPKNPEKIPDRVVLDFSAKHGSVIVRLVCPSSIGDKNILSAACAQPWLYSIMTCQSQ